MNYSFHSYTIGPSLGIETKCDAESTVGGCCAAQAPIWTARFFPPAVPKGLVIKMNTVWVQCFLKIKVNRKNP